jgi:ribosomal protein S18 acetylase RimI-like enzyme
MIKDYIKKLIHESLNNLSIINVEDCHEESYEVTLPNGDEIDCNELIIQIEDIFKTGGIRALYNEHPYSVLADNDGNVVGALVFSTDTVEDTEGYDVSTEIIFSIVIYHSVQRQGWARKMIQDFIKNKTRRINVIKADVINPNMVPLLLSLGFKKEEKDYNRLNKNYYVLDKRYE